MDLGALETEWLSRSPELRQDPDAFGWEPYPLEAFGELLAAAIPAAQVPEFCDLGCGIGTKCLAAAAEGLRAQGVEVVPEYAAVAEGLGVPVAVADLRTWDGLGGLGGIVYVNCPLRDEAAEAALEARIHQALPGGAVLVQVNDCGAPDGWEPVWEDRAGFRGVYVKPGA